MVGTILDMTSNTASAILNRVVQPNGSGLSTEVARFILSMDFPQVDHRRMQLLSVNASEGTLSTDEEVEFGNYLRISQFLALMQLKARRALYY